MGMKLPLMTPDSSLETYTLHSTGQRRQSWSRSWCSSRHCHCVTVVAGPPRIFLPALWASTGLASTRKAVLLSDNKVPVSKPVSDCITACFCLPSRAHADYIFHGDSMARVLLVTKVSAGPSEPCMSTAACGQHLRCHGPLCCPGYPQLCQHPGFCLGPYKDDKLQFEHRSFTERAWNTLRNLGRGQVSWGRERLTDSSNDF